jgi:predicted alpha/beta hydrolase
MRPGPVHDAGRVQPSSEAEAEIDAPVARAVRPGSSWTPPGAADAVADVSAADIRERQRRLGQQRIREIAPMGVFGLRRVLA